MSAIHLQTLQKIYRQLTEDLRRAEDRMAFLQDEEECARISLQRAKTEKSRAILAYRCNSIEITEEEEEHANEIVSKHQEQLNWLQIQLAVAEEERDRLRDEWQRIEDQIKNGKSHS